MALTSVFHLPNCILHTFTQCSCYSKYTSFTVVPKCYFSRDPATLYIMIMSGASLIFVLFETVREIPAWHEAYPSPVRTVLVALTKVFSPLHNFPFQSVAFICCVQSSRRHVTLECVLLAIMTGKSEFSKLIC